MKKKSYVKIVRQDPETGEFVVESTSEQFEISPSGARFFVSLHDYFRLIASHIFIGFQLLFFRIADEIQQPPHRQKSIAAAESQLVRRENVLPQLRYFRWLPTAVVIAAPIWFLS